MKFRMVAVLLVALASGCLEDKETLTVQANGSGKIHVWRHLSEELTKSQIEGAGDAAAQEKAAQRAFCATLGVSEGIVAWQDVSVKIEKKQIVEEATGYFEDVTKLKLQSALGDPVANAFSWKKNADGGYTLAWAAQDLGLAGAFDHALTAEEKKNEKAMRDQSRTLVVERTVVLPGKITEAKGATAKERAATAAASGKDAAALFDFIEKARQRIAKKEITKEKATEEAKEKGAKLAMGIEATCGPPTEDAAAFAKELEAAKAAYKGSALEKEVKGGN